MRIRRAALLILSVVAVVAACADNDDPATESALQRWTPIKHLVVLTKLTNLT